MNLTDINEIKKEGLDVFMPSGIQATLFKEGEDIIVQYPNLHKDKYTNEAFKKIMDEGIFIFSEQPTIPQQSVLMEHYNEDVFEAVLEYATEQGKQVAELEDEDAEIIAKYVSDKIGLNVYPEEIIELLDMERSDMEDLEDDMDESVLDMLHKKGYIRESLANQFKEQQEKDLSFLGIDETQFNNKQDLIKYIEENTDYDVLGSGDYWLDIQDKTKNNERIRINLQNKLSEAFEKVKRKEGDVFKGLKQEKEYITPEFKNELLTSLTKLAKEHPEVKIRQQALTFMDELGLQEYYDIKAVKDFINKYTDLLNAHVNESLNEELQYGVEYRDMHTGIHQLLITDTKEKAEEILGLLNKLENPEPTEDENERADNAYFTWDIINQLANDCIEVDYHETEEGDGNYNGIYIINYNEIKPDIYESLNEEDDKFNYMMLDRLKQDCEYYLGNGNRNEKRLWAGNVKDQIAEMRKIYDKLPEKPEWISLEDIDNYEREMLSKDETINEEELVMNANLENIANEIASGNKEGFEPNEFGNWYLMTSLDQKWNSITDFMKQTILENISEYILKGEVSKDNIEIGFNDAYEQEDLESLDMFSDENIEELLVGDTEILTAEISYELKFDNQIDNLGESFKLKQKKKTKKKLDEKSRGINMKKLKECCYKVYNSIEGKDCGVFNSWNDVEAFLDKEYGNYATEFKSENPDYIGTCNKDEFLANYELDIIQEPNPEKVSNVEVKSIVRNEVTNDKAEMTKNTEIVPIEQKEEPGVCDNCPECGCNPCECEKELTEEVDLNEPDEQASTVDNIEKDDIQNDDENKEKDKIESPQGAENAIEKLDDLVDDLEDYIKSLTDDVELSQEEMDEMCMEGPRNPKKSTDNEDKDKQKEKNEKEKNEEFKDNMGMLTDINDLDFPDALHNAVDTKEDGSLFRIADIAKMVQDLKSEMDTLKTDIKDMLSELKQGIKDEVKDIQSDVNSKLDNTDSKISDLTSDEEAEEDIEFMDEEPEESEEPQSEEEENTKDKQKEEEQVEESMLDEETLKGNPVWEAMQEVMKENKHPKGYMSIVTMSEKLREDYGINTKIQSTYNTVSNLCLHTSIKEHIVDVETEKESLKESLLGKATKWLSKGLMGKCAELKEAEQREELNKVKAEIDKLHNEKKDNKIKDTIALMADDEKEAEEAINYALDKVQENKVNSLKETLLKTSNSAKLNTIRFGE